MKKVIFANKIEQFDMSMSKQILGFKKFINNIKILSELGRTLLEIDIETKMFKCFQRFPFIETKIYYSKPSKKKNLIQNARFRI